MAAVLHLPFTPLPWVAHWLWPYLNREDSWDYEDDTVTIPVTLLESPPEQPPEVAAPPPANDPKQGGAAEAASANRPQPRPEASAGKADAGVPPHDAGIGHDAGKALRDGGGTDATLADAGTKRPGDSKDGGAGTSASASADAGSRGSPADGGTRGNASVEDTLSLAGGLARTSKGKPNVAIAIWFSTIREHQLGRIASDVFRCVPQWRDFLGNTVDPTEELDGALLFGPRMADSSKVTIIVQTRMEQSRIKEILGGLVRSGRGTGAAWMEAGRGELAARFRADRADRIAFTHPQHLVIVTPPEGYEQLHAVREALSLPASRGRAISLTMVTPWRPARARGLALPDTLSELRLDLLASADGGVDVAVELDDKDASSAEEHAALLTREIAELVSLYGGIAGSFLQTPHFVARDHRIAGRVHLSSLASGLLLGWVRGQLCGFGDAGVRSLR